MTTATDTQEKFHDLLGGFQTAMLVTQTPAGLMRGRPMAIAKVEPDSDLWFVTDDHSGKVDEIAADANVAVIFQTSMRYLSVSGRAHVVRDRPKIHELWHEAWRVWFPGGKDDPKIVLIRVTTSEGEFWDNGGLQGLKYFFEAGKAYLAGKRPEVDGQQHARTTL